MSRRVRVISAGAFACSAILLALVGASPAAQAPPRLPNILLIVADDLGYGDLGSYGQARIRTPNLDRLAGQGVRFTQFYAGSPVCAPSRNVLMTGQHAGRVLIRGNAKIDLRPADVTIAEVLRRAGYTTGLVGKWGLGKEGSTGAPRAKGFDYFFGYVDQTHAHNYFPHFLVRNEQHVPLRNIVPKPGQYGQGVAIEKVEYSADLLADDALAFVERHKDRPFFLFFSPTLPHANNEAGAEGMEVPDYGEYAREEWPAPQKALAAMVTRLDRHVGRLLDRLDELGLAPDTVVMFTSDNGPHREGGNDPHFFDSNGPLRGIKRDLYEGGIRVPMIVRWPGRTPPGRTTDHAAYLGDVFATAADIAKAPLPRDLDSISFLPVVTGDPTSQKTHEFLYWEFYEGGSSQAVRMKSWKALRAPMFSGRTELYDLSNDMSEQRDVASDNPDIVKRMQAVMDQAHVPSALWKVRAQPAPAVPQR